MAWRIVERARGLARPVRAEADFCCVMFGVRWRWALDAHYDGGWLALQIGPLVLLITWADTR